MIVIVTIITIITIVIANTTIYFPCIFLILSSAALALLSLSNFILISSVMPLASSIRLS